VGAAGLASTRPFSGAKASRRTGRELEIAKERPHRPEPGDLLSLVETALGARPIADYEGPPTRRYSSAFQSAGESGA